MYHVNANGANIPALGFGTFRIPEDDVRRILPEALKLGFRHVDTAQIYKRSARSSRNQAFPGTIFSSPPRSGWTATGMMIF
jgi:diketogulonate reductase-like aldo/keto reductase